MQKHILTLLITAAIAIIAVACSSCPAAKQDAPQTDNGRIIHDFEPKDLKFYMPRQYSIADNSPELAGETKAYLDSLVWYMNENYGLNVSIKCRRAATNTNMSSVCKKIVGPFGDYLKSKGITADRIFFNIATENSGNDSSGTKEYVIIQLRQ